MESWEQLEKQMAKQKPNLDDVINYSTWTTSELMDAYLEETQNLRNLEEMIRPRTREGRETHSRRAAIRILLAQRGAFST